MDRMPAGLSGDAPRDDATPRSPPAMETADDAVDCDHRCRLCGGSFTSARIESKEMIFGTGEEFVFRQCGACESLELEDVPDDMSRYYPDVYPAFGWNSWLVDAVGSLVFCLSFLDKGLVRTMNTSIVSALQPHVLGVFGVIPRIRWLTNVMEPNPDLRILDIGCGSGIHLRILRVLGYRNLTGVDPYLRKPTDARGVTLIRGGAESVRGPFDLVLLNHSLEHMPEPREVMRRVESLLSDNGRCIIRIPVVPSYAWERFGGNWAQLDPPRHLFIPSVKGLEGLASDCGLRIASLRYVSDDFQFWGSEQVSKGIMLLADGSYAKSRRGSMFSRRQIRDFRITSERLNAEGRGDEVVAVFKKERNRGSLVHHIR